MRRLGLTLMLLAAAASANGQTAVKSDTCVPDVADIYGFNASPRFSQHEFELYAAGNNPGIFLLLVDSASDTVGFSAGNDRFLHLSVGLISGRHRLLVACSRRTDYSVVRRNGNEKALQRGGTIAYGQRADLRGKAARPEENVPLHLEVNLQRAAAKLAGALQP